MDTFRPFPAFQQQLYHSSPCVSPPCIRHFGSRLQLAVETTAKEASTHARNRCDRTMDKLVFLTLSCNHWRVFCWAQWQRIQWSLCCLYPSDLAISPGNKWIYVSDKQNVSKACLGNKLKARQAYMLFYEKIMECWNNRLYKYILSI